jgi:hypothetical protein
LAKLARSLFNEIGLYLNFKILFMKTKTLLFAFVCTLISFMSFAQEQRYAAPEDVVNGNIRLNVSDLIGNEGVYKFKLTITNSSKTDYYSYDINKTGFEIEGAGTIYPAARRNKVVIKPGGKKGMVINVKGGPVPTVTSFKLHLDGLFSGKPNVLVNAMADMTVSESNMANVQGEEVGIKISKVKHLKKDLYRFSIQSQISYNEITDNGLNLLIFDRDMLEVKDGSNLLPLTFLPLNENIIEEGESKKFKFDTETAGSFSMNINWNKALKKVVMVNVPVADITVGNPK